MKEKIFFRTEYKYPGYKIFMFEIYFFQERTFLNFRKSSPVANPDKGSHYLKKSPSPTGVKSPPGHCCHKNLSHWWPIYGFIVEGLCFCGSLMHLVPIWGRQTKELKLSDLVIYFKFLSLHIAQYIPDPNKMYCIDTNLPFSISYNQPFGHLVNFTID